MVIGRIFLFIYWFPVVQLFDYCMFLSHGKEVNNRYNVELAKAVIAFLVFIFIGLLMGLIVFQILTVKTQYTSR